MIKNEKEYRVYGWMITSLKLKNSELLVYAALYHLTDNGQTDYDGSIGLVAELAGCCRSTVHRVLTTFIEKGLVERLSESPNSAKYRIIKR